MEREKRIGRVGKAILAGALALGSTGAAPAVENEASAATVRTYNCNTTADKWYPLTKGEIVVSKASGIIIPADVTVDGVKQYDDDPNTASVIVLKTSDNRNANWVINNDYAGSVKVLKCGATFGATYSAAGKEAATSDKRLGTNNPTKRVNFNWVQK